MDDTDLILHTQDSQGPMDWHTFTNTLLTAAICITLNECYRKLI